MTRGLKPPRYGVVKSALVEGNYRIAYLIRPDGDIDILGVIHGALPIERYLPLTKVVPGSAV